MTSSEFDWTLDPTKTALIVVDIQNDYCKDEGFFSSVLNIDTSPAKRIIPPLKRLLAAARSADVAIIYIVSQRDPARAERMVHKIRPELLRTKWIGGPTLGTWGARIIEEISPRGNDQVIVKDRNDAFYNTELEKVLNRLRVDTLVFSGVATNGCVETTMRSAFCRDFDIVLVKDCTASFDLGYGCDVFLATVRNVEKHMGVAVSSSQIIRMMNAISVH